MKKEKADQNAVAELTREWLYKENKWLWEENRKLRFELWESQTHRWVDVKDLKNKVEHQKSALKSMEKQIKELKEDLEHSDSFFSLMRDVLANENVSSYALWDIVNAVVKEECWAEDELDEEDLEIVKKFWNGYYRTF